MPGSKNSATPRTLPVTKALAEALCRRFGASIATAVVNALDLAGNAPLDEETVDLAIAMACAAEFAAAGSAFVEGHSFSALGDAPEFRIACSLMSIDAAALGAYERMRIDIEFARLCRLHLGRPSTTAGRERAVALLAEALLSEAAGDVLPGD